MASTEPAHPLRLSKDSRSSTPTKMASAIPRPLSELSPTEKRRNSPSWNQQTKKMALNTDSSPFHSSPLESAGSPRLFWQNRGLNNSENTPFGSQFGQSSSSSSPIRRSSIERLQKASRVRNSNILALEQKNEYDPTRIPQIERPLSKVQGNAFGGSGANAQRSDGRPAGHQRSESKSGIPFYSPNKAKLAGAATAPAVTSPPNPPATPTPSGNNNNKDQTSPMKSSLSTSRFKSSFDPETGTWSADNSCDERELPEGKSLQRHPKSVTFDAAPPQVNEYEMATPDLSSIGSNSREGSYDSEEDDEDDEDGYHYATHGQDPDDSFDASLEDTDKTPVVGPDDWRQGSHESREYFEHSPKPDEMPGPVQQPRQHRADSTASSSDHRPLPPLPGVGGEPSRSLSLSPSGLSATAERMVGSQRSLPSPPPAPFSKSEIQNFGNGKMTLEERLKLMMLSDDGKSAAELQRERRMRRAVARDHPESQTPEHEVHSSPVVSPATTNATATTAQEEAEEAREAEDTVGDISALEDYQLPPRISRESILRRANGNKTFDTESDFALSSPAPSSPERSIPYDPDVPIPSTEKDPMSEDEEDEDEDEEGSVIVRRDVDDNDADVYSITDMYQHSDGDFSDREMDDDHMDDNDAESQYSVEDETAGPSAREEDASSTPRATSPAGELPTDVGHGAGAGSHQRSFSNDKKDDLAATLRTCVLPPPSEPRLAREPEGPKIPEITVAHQRPHTPMTKPEYDGSGWGYPDDEYDEDPGTPDSVIHHPLDEYDEQEDESEVFDSPIVPERVATIRSSSGSKLKTRPSATPSDLASMREARRHVSREIPNVPPIPERHRNRNSHDLTNDRLAPPGGDDLVSRHPSFKKRSLTLDLDLGLSLDQDFDRVIEAQKVAFQQLHHHQPQAGLPPPSSSRQAPRRDGDGGGAPAHQAIEPPNTDISLREQRGYLMRQNTKLVAASDKDTDEQRGYRSAGNSPVKQSRPQSWTVEPWNGQMRRKSVKAKRPGTAAATAGPAPPLPGQESNAVPTQNPTDEDLAADLAVDESGERGRLFVKVMGVKDLDLPLPKNERTWFSLTLDNGVHCVTTAWLELARNAPIGQEFELVVPNDLEFQLTLNVKLEKPAPKKAIQSPTKASKPKSVSTFSRVFASPRKRKEMELRQREEEERLAQLQREAQAKQLNAQPSAWELLSPLVADDGSFARAYVCLKEHEAKCFGRPYLAEVASFNEWATEEASFASSVKSKRGSTAVVRRAPYKIGKLELQLLFVPRPKGATDDDMPKSMNSCIREMKAAEERLSRNWEGHLSQQGGDCPYWRRRYFKLVGTKLTAYHEATRQPRATINLSNAKRLIDDRRALTERETTGRNGKRRRSAFAEEEEGYMFVEEGFRIRFNNGEVIDFYADNTSEKEEWMKVLSDVICRDSIGSVDDVGSAAAASAAFAPKGKGKWCDHVLKREETLRRRAEGRRVHSRTKSMYV